MSNVASLEAHLERTRETKNADPERLQENKNMRPFGSIKGMTMVERVKNLMPEKIRKNAVLAVEHMLTASPEYFTNKNKYEIYKWAQINIDWVAEKYGEKNIVSANLHMDETTPHLHVVVVPIVKNKLNASFYFGKKSQLSQMQTDYAVYLQSKKDEIEHLDRGILGSKATHQSIQKFYGTVDNINGRTRPKKESILDLGYTQRLEEYVDKVEKYVKRSTLAKEEIKRAKSAGEIYKKNAEEYKNLVDDLVSEKDVYKQFFDQLEPKEIEILLKRAIKKNEIEGQKATQKVETSQKLPDTTPNPQKRPNRGF